MKWSLLALLLSFSAQATTCFVRDVELETDKVTMAKEICINDIKITIDPFKDSKATIGYTLDGIPKTKVLRIYMPIERGDGRYGTLVESLEYDTNGGLCSEKTDAKVMGMLVMDRSGDRPEIEVIEGKVTYTSDSCHSTLREIQSLAFRKI